MSLLAPMKRISLRKTIAPTPRLTVWVPVMIAGGLSLVWLVFLALVRF